MGCNRFGPTTHEVDELLAPSWPVAGSRSKKDTVDNYVQWGRACMWNIENLFVLVSGGNYRISKGELPSPGPLAGM